MQKLHTFKNEGKRGAAPIEILNDAEVDVNNLLETASGIDDIVVKDEKGLRKVVFMLVLQTVSLPRMRVY